MCRRNGLWVPYCLRRRVSVREQMSWLRVVQHGGAESPGARDGFYSEVLFVLNQAAWAAAQGLATQVVMGLSSAWWDSKVSSNAWMHYFEQPSRQWSGDIRESDVYELSCNFSGALYAANDAAMPIYSLNPEQAEITRQQRGEQVKRFLRVRSNITDELDRIWAEDIKPAPGSIVLGVHMRGTDKRLDGGRVPPALYFEAIDAFIEWHEGKALRPVVLLLATDDTSYERLAISRYGNRVRQQLNVPRLDGNATCRSVWRCPRTSGIWDLAWDRSDGSKRVHPGTSATSLSGFARGFSVLMDTLLLARADYLIKSGSAVSEFAIYFNPELAMWGRTFDLSPQLVAHSRMMWNSSTWLAYQHQLQRRTNRNHPTVS